jgi:bifunctional non-homologous end joining protein LigD
MVTASSFISINRQEARFHINGLDWTKRFSAIAGAFDIPRQAILNGEAVVIEDGRTNFSELQAKVWQQKLGRLNRPSSW